LRAALGLIAHRGIEATRVEDITDAADLGKGAFYNYFDSKQALVAELVAEGLACLDRDYLSRLPEHTTLAERAAALARQHAAFFEEHPTYLLLLHQARGLLQLRDRREPRLASIFSGYLRRLADLLLPAGESAGWSESARLNVAAALAGAVAGQRSFQIAAGIDGGLELLSELLARGVEGLQGWHGPQPAPSAPSV